MATLLGSKAINTANGVRRGTLTVDRGIGGTGRIRSVSLTIDGFGYVSFAHVRETLTQPPHRENVAQRLEALRGSACPMSAVRVRRYERGNVDINQNTPGIDA